MVLVFAEKDGDNFKKSSYEAISYGRDLADKMGTTCAAVAIGSDNGAADLGKYGAQTVYVHSGHSSEFEAGEFSQAISEAIDASGAHTVIFSGSYTGKILAPKVAVKKNASLVTGVVDMASTENGVSVRKTCFSNKAFTQVQLNNDFKVISIVPNSYEIKEVGGNAEVSALSSDLSSHKQTESIEVDKVVGKIPLTEAELVVSAGRGLKGPENWGMIDELADLLGAATACSKPVSDMDWRPHSEHVGQTGITIKPNLYIAIGISGAIQHLAGVGGSKVICVINTDPEAPFFKAADYGIVGDAFEVIPKLIKRVQELRS